MGASCRYESTSLWHRTPQNRRGKGTPSGSRRRPLLLHGTLPDQDTRLPSTTKEAKRNQDPKLLERNNPRSAHSDHRKVEGWAGGGRRRGASGSLGRSPCCLSVELAESRRMRPPNRIRRRKGGEFFCMYFRSESAQRLRLLREEGEEERDEEVETEGVENKIK